MSKKTFFQKYAILFIFMGMFAVINEYLIKLKKDNNALRITNITQESVILDLMRRYVKQSQEIELDSIAETMDDVGISPRSRAKLDSIRERQDRYNRFSADTDSLYIQKRYSEVYKEYGAIK